MRKVTLWLLLFTTLLEATDKVYDHPLTTENKELLEDISSYRIKIFIANLRRRRTHVRLMKHRILCESRCNETRSKTFYCHCDDNCQLYRDCCYDYWKSCNKNKTVKKSEQDRWKCVSDMHRQHIMQPLWYHFPHKVVRIKGHMMISTCKTLFPEHENKCLNPDPNTTLQQVPVEGPDNATYKNIYCALCNGKPPDNIINWRYELICSRTNYVHLSANEQLKISNCAFKKLNCSNEHWEYVQNNCSWYYAPPSNHSKNDTICSPVTVCPQIPGINMTALKYHELTLKCQAYMIIVYHKGTYYKNFHCALCHGVDPAELQSFPSTIMFPTISLFFEIPQARFKRRENTIFITNGTNTTEQKNNGSTFTNTKELPGEMFLHSAGAAVSMATLILLLITYSLAKPLRTTPGKIIMCLSISLLVYQAILFASQNLSKKAISCSIGAICLHFAILSTFSWMSIMSYDIWKTFGKTANAVPNKSTFKFYILYSVMNPLVLVGTAIIVDQSGLLVVYWPSEEMESSNKCWIVTSLSHLLFFIIPVGLSLGFNIISLFWAVIGITRVQQETRRVQKSNTPQFKDNINNLQMYVKLSIVMGVTWVLGFIIEYSLVARYLYVLLNSFQGFFIFLSFVTNKRVLKKWRESRRSSTQSSGLNMRKSAQTNT